MLRLVPPPVLWIVVEMNAASTETADVLRGMGIMYRHLVSGKNFTDVKDRGCIRGIRRLSILSVIGLTGLFILRMMIMSIRSSFLRR